MFRKTAATAVALTFALTLPVEALGLGGLRGGLGGRGKGKSTSSGSSSSATGSSSSSTSGTSSSSSRTGGGVSAGASVGRGGISAGASVGGVGVGASVGRSGVSAGASAGSTASAGASVSRSGVAAGTSVGGLGVGASVGQSGVSANIDGLSPSSPSTGQQAPSQPAAVQALAAAGPAALLLLPLPPALQPSRDTKSCVRENGCRTSPKLMEGRAATRAAIPTRDDDDADRLAQRPGTPASIVSACQLAATRAAQAYGAVSVEAASFGKFTATESGGGIAPVTIRVNYPGATGSRQARVSCAINSDGVVTGLAV